jgi:hypothetical protein
LPVRDWQRLVQVGSLDEVGRDEASSWHLVQGLKKAGVVHAFGDDAWMRSSCLLTSSLT